MAACYHGVTKKRSPAISEAPDTADGSDLFDILSRMNGFRIVLRLWVKCRCPLLRVFGFFVEAVT